MKYCICGDHAPIVCGECGGDIPDASALQADNARLVQVLEVVLDDLMYRDHKRVIDLARQELARQAERVGS